MKEKANSEQYIHAYAHDDNQIVFWYFVSNEMTSPFKCAFSYAYDMPMVYSWICFFIHITHIIIDSLSLSQTLCAHYISFDCFIGFYLSRSSCSFTLLWPVRVHKIQMVIQNQLNWQQTLQTIALMDICTSRIRILIPLLPKMYKACSPTCYWILHVYLYVCSYINKIK